MKSKEKHPNREDDVCFGLTLFAQKQKFKKKRNGNSDYEYHFNNLISFTNSVHTERANNFPIILLGESNPE